LKSSKFLLYIFVLQVIVFVTLVLDIPIGRQLSGFIFLTFIPGYLILSLLKLDRFNRLETFLFSVGASLAFLMFIGFLINELGSLNLVSNPLSTETLALIINIVIFLMCIFRYFRVKDFDLINFNFLRFRQILPYFILPILSVLGVMLIRVFNNNILMIFVFIIISILFTINFLTSKFSLFYPIIILSIAIALLLSTTLMSNYVYGSDICFEFDALTVTKTLSYWDSQLYYYYDFFAANSMLSVTILPTIFSNLLNIPGDWVFKIIFPLIFSLIPLALYQLYEEQWGKKTAFISAIFFIMNFEFYSIMISVAKEMIAEFFFVLLFLLLLKKNRDYVKSNWIHFIFLIFGLIVSHYSVNYIFILLLLFTWFFRKILFKNKNLKIDFSIISFSFSFTFAWYIFLVQGAYQKFVNVAHSMSSNFLAELFFASSRGTPVQTALGIVESPTFLHSLGKIIHNITTLLILFGFISLIYRWKKQRVDSDYFLLTTLNMGLIFLAIIVPRFSGYLEMGRLYHITLIFLAPLIVLGAQTLFDSTVKLRSRKKEGAPNQQKGTAKKYSSIFISIILLIFFFFQTGFVYEITGDPLPTSIALSNYKMEDSFILIHENDLFGAVWLSKNGDVQHLETYSDTVSFHHVLTAYSNLKRDMTILSNNTVRIVSPSYIYFSQYNVKTGLVVYNQRISLQYEISKLPILNSETVVNNKIYSNGGSEIYFLTP